MRLLFLIGLIGQSFSFPALLAGLVPFVRCRGAYPCLLESPEGIPFVTANFTSFDIKIGTSNSIESDGYLPVLRLEDSSELYHPVGLLKDGLVCPDAPGIEFVHFLGPGLGVLAYPFSLNVGCSDSKLIFVKFPFTLAYSAFTPTAFFDRFFTFTTNTPIFHPIYSNYSEKVIPFQVNPAPLADEIYNPAWGIQYTPYPANFKAINN